MSEFSDRPFVAGTILGLRTFGVDKLGRLTAVNWADQVWTPGENVGVCLKKRMEDMQRGYFVYTQAAHAVPGCPCSQCVSYSYTQPMQILPSSLSTPVYPITTNAVAPLTVDDCPDGHKVASVDCQCGYYAYFDGRHNTYHSHEKVLGVIEGYGLVTVGSLGFRAAKARIKALVVNQAQRSDDLTIHRTVTLYSQAGVPIYETTAAALAEFPVAPPELPAVDDDFWTRRIS